ncbi:PEP-CTERM sorting domain-containing protein [Paucibacter soli]|uniref:PEP-CTERM sorting domain-containing protein n=1 Tax=Paucibacter soli TaxID=3133433 RepID=UPI0030AD51C0
MNIKALIAVAALAAAPHLASAQAQVTLSAASQTVDVGDTFSLLVDGLGFNTTPANLPINNFQGGQNVAFSFDASILELLSVSIDPIWSFRALPGTIDNAAGKLTGVTFLVTPALVPAGPDYSFHFATLQFRALGAGTGHVAVTGGTFVGKVNNQAARSIAPTLGSAEVNVVSVPEPSTYALMLAGIVAVGSVARRRSASSRA